MTIDVSPLFEPLEVGSVKLRNRVVMAPMTRNFAPGTVVGDDVAAYYRKRAAADVGLIVTEGIGIDHPTSVGDAGAGTRKADIPVLYGEAQQAGWKKVVDEIHDAGGVVFPQLWHMGVYKVEGSTLHPTVPGLRPSGLYGPMADWPRSIPEGFIEKAQVPNPPAKDEDIQDVIDAYARSAKVSKELGFDGIAVHGAHGYLIDTFIWHRETNKRDDKWGGDLAGRMSFGKAVIRAIREAIGPNMPIMHRFSQWKQQDYAGHLAKTPQELEIVVGAYVDAGVDIFDVSTRRFADPAFEGSDLTLAGWTKKITGKPTSAVGGIGLGDPANPADVRSLEGVVSRMKAGEFDLVSVGRALISDPEWVIKTRKGEGYAPFEMKHHEYLY